MGWSSFELAIEQEDLIIEGPKELTKITKQWLGHSSVANIKKANLEDRINY